MYATNFESDSERRAVPKEGDLFKFIQLHGKVFEIRYGFYEETDRLIKNAEPMEIYPDFNEAPQYTDDGIPFVTQMQSPCERFDGILDENSGCGDCAFYRNGDELIGTCDCIENRKTSDVREAVRIE